LKELPNLGLESEAMRMRSGIKRVAPLRAVGAVRAPVKRHGTAVSLNLLWALEGALSGRRWQDVAKHGRLRLLLEQERLEMGEQG
jgi:DNA transformation protein